MLGKSYLIGSGYGRLGHVRSGKFRLVQFSSG
jgi:hypothetical protein